MVGSGLTSNYSGLGFFTTTDCAWGP